MDLSHPLTEKLVFNYIFNHSEQLDRIPAEFFITPEINKIYGWVKHDYQNSKVKIVPSTEQVVSIVRKYDSNIPDGYIVQLCEDSSEKYSTEYLEELFKVWNIVKNANDITDQCVENQRNLKNVNNFEDAMTIINQNRVLWEEAATSNIDEDDMGLDFSDPLSHKQDLNKIKLKSGWEHVDNVIDGGFDYATLAVLVGSTGAGKSMWLTNLASNMLQRGMNVIYFTFELGDKKVIKRIACQTLKIVPKLYEQESKNPEYIKNKLRSAGFLNNPGTRKIGKLFVKKYPTSSATITDLENFIKKFEQTKKIKVDAICVDYINLLAVEKHLANIGNMLFLKGKHFAEGLRRIADTFNILVATATQTDKDVWGSNDISLKDIPESKAVAETSDVVFGIIRNPKMKVENKYRLKLLKFRDGESKEQQIEFDFDPNTLAITGDKPYIPITKN